MCIVGCLAYGICITKIIDNIILNDFPTCSDDLRINSSAHDILIPCNKRVAGSRRLCKGDCIFNRIFAWILCIVGRFAY